MHFPAYNRFFLFRVWIIFCIHILHFIHSSISGHVSAIYATMNTRVQIYLSGSDFISFTCIPRNGIARIYGSFTFSILRSLHIVSHRGSHFAFSQQSARFQFFHILQLLCFVFVNGHLNKCDLISHCDFGFAFLWWLMMLSTFLFTYCPLSCFLWRNIYSIPWFFFL